MKEIIDKPISGALSFFLSQLTNLKFQQDMYLLWTIEPVTKKTLLLRHLLFGINDGKLSYQTNFMYTTVHTDNLRRPRLIPHSYAKLLLGTIKPWARRAHGIVKKGQSLFQPGPTAGFVNDYSKYQSDNDEASHRR